MHMYVLFSDNNFEPKLFNLVTAITTYGVEYYLVRTISIFLLILYVGFIRLKDVSAVYVANDL